MNSLTRYEMDRFSEYEEEGGKLASTSRDVESENE